MATQVESKPIDADENRREKKSDTSNRFSMVQGIRGEIVAMLAAKRRGFSVDDYYHLADVGILDEDDRVELIDGEIIVMSPINSPHASGVKAFNREFARKLGDRAIVSVQDPIHLNDNTEPQPDIALIRYRDDFYASAHPTPDDILLLVEVADSSLERDREKARGTYAKHGIPEVWIANLSDDCVERYRNPAQDGYADVSEFRRGDTISPSALPDVELAIDDILP